MTHFLVEYREIGSPQQRAAHREEHIAYRKGIGEGMPLAGPILDEAGNSVGSLVILEAADLRDASRIATSDPYVAAGVLELVSVRSYRIASLKPIGSG